MSLYKVQRAGKTHCSQAPSSVSNALNNVYVVYGEVSQGSFDVSLLFSLMPALGIIDDIFQGKTNLVSGGGGGSGGRMYCRGHAP